MTPQAAPRALTPNGTLQEGSDAFEQLLLKRTTSYTQRGMHETLIEEDLDSLRKKDGGSEFGKPLRVVAMIVANDSSSRFCAWNRGNDMRT